MKPPVILGVVLAALLLAAMFVPRLTPATPAAQVEAVRKAEAARRLLHRYIPILPLAAQRADAGALRETDLEALAKLAEAPLQQIGQSLAQRVRASQRLNERSGIGGEAQVSVQATGAALQSALTGFQQFVKDNQALLSSAEALAREADQTSSGQFYAAQIAGLVAYVRAAGAVAEAGQQRAQLVAALDGLLLKALEWRAARAQADHYAALETSDALDTLRAEMADVQTQLEAASEAASKISQQVASRAAELDGARAGLQAARTQLEQVQAQSFRPGDEASFQAYRSAYERLAEQMRSLQESEQLLAAGGRRNAELEGDMLNEAAVVGGEAVTGLESLKQFEALAQARKQKLSEALETLQQRVQFIESNGKAAAVEKVRYEQRAKDARSALDLARDQIEQLVKGGAALDGQALKLARDAQSAFRNSASAAERAIAEARELQGRLDPNRTNERLKKITGDQISPMIGTSSGAAARLLAGQALSQAAEALVHYLAITDQVGALVRDLAFDRPAVQTELQTARDEGVRAVGEARDALTRLGSANTNAGRMAQGSLSIAYLLLARLEPAAAAAHRSKALEAINAAVARAERHPEVADIVRLRNALRGGSAEPAPAAPAAEEGEPATPESTGG